MLKVYAKATTVAGVDAASWDHVWDTVEADHVLAGMNSNYLTHRLAAYLPRGRILEGGCGPGHYVAHYGRAGFDMVGLDFAPRSLREARRLAPDAPLLAGDITRLPFRDGSFDGYFSGGVVEHAEAGPNPALQEARRVLKPDGTLLITVPFVNSFRALKYRDRTGQRNWEGHIMKYVEDFVMDESPDPDYHFFEYRFSDQEFRNILKRNGFEVLGTMPCSFFSGDLGYAISRVRRRQNAAPIATRSASPELQVPGGMREKVRSLLATEHSEHALLRFIISRLNRLSGHMLLAVCQPV